MDIFQIVWHFPVVQRLELTAVLWTGLPTSFKLGLGLLEGWNQGKTLKDVLSLIGFPFYLFSFLHLCCSFLLVYFGETNSYLWLGSSGLWVTVVNMFTARYKLRHDLSCTGREKALSRVDVVLWRRRRQRIKKNCLDSWCLSAVSSECPTIADIASNSWCSYCRKWYLLWQILRLKYHQSASIF